MITVTEAIQSLNKDAEVRVGGFGTDDITWLGGTTAIPVAEIDAEIIRLQAEYDAKKYQRDRQPEYPPIADQQDMQFHDAIDGTTTWQDAIQAVKDKYPKPE